MDDSPLDEERIPSLNMRKKALLMGADAPFYGPWVPIEEGNWIVGYIDTEVVLNILTERGDSCYFMGDSFRIIGPNRVRVELVSGINVSLDIRLVANA